MPSTAFTGHLTPLLVDADALLAAHRAIPVGAPSRMGSLAAINRAVVVACISAWEAYIEELLREAIETLRPAGPPMGTWPALNATVRGAIGGFNTPNTDQVRILISDALGLQDDQNSWTWTNCTPAQARARLQQAMDYRHEIAHGVNPRPVVSHRYSSRLPGFFRQLGLYTDAAVRAHLVAALGIVHPWPP